MTEPTRLTDEALERLLAKAREHLRWLRASPTYDTNRDERTTADLLDTVTIELRSLVEEVTRLRARNEQLEDALMAMSLTADIQWKEPR